MHMKVSFKTPQTGMLTGKRACEFEHFVSSRKWLLATSFSFALTGAHFANAQSQWTKADDFQLVRGFSSVGSGLGINESGNVIAVGYGITDGSGTTVAITRE